jgi:aspartate 1-decarboxylase
MFFNMFKSKIHRATVTEADLNYVGSITIDRTLMQAAGILPGEKVQVVDINNGNRFETYTLEGPSDSGVVCINGAAARLVQPGDKVIIITYCWLEAEQAKAYKPTVIFVDDSNAILPENKSPKHSLTLV